MFSKKVKVDCTKNAKAGMIFTLVDNEAGSAKEFINSGCVLEYLVDNFGKAKKKLDELVKEKEKEDTKWKTYKFFINKKIAPFTLNQFTSSPHVKEWEASNSGLFEEEGMVVVEYVADKQILFQTPDGVAVEL